MPLLRNPSVTIRFWRSDSIRSAKVEARLALYALELVEPPWRSTVAMPRFGKTYNPMAAPALALSHAQTPVIPVGLTIPRMIELAEGEQQQLTLEQAFSARDLGRRAALGVGVAGIGIGELIGRKGADGKSEHYGDCSDGDCASSVVGLLDDHRTLQPISGWSFVKGTFALSAGGLLLFVGPSGQGGNIRVGGTF